MEIYGRGLEEKIFELGFDLQHQEDFTPASYRLINKEKRAFIVRLVGSEPIENVIQESNNGNIIQAIGHFKFILINEIKEPAFSILGFQNFTNQRSDFVIISTKELKRRLIKKKQISKPYHKTSIVFWLMDDKFLYDCTGVGVQWEWYYLSRGLNGRMVDGSVWDYTEYLNDWDRLKRV